MSGRENTKQNSRCEEWVASRHASIRAVQWPTPGMAWLGWLGARTGDEHAYAESIMDNLKASFEDVAD